MKECEIALDGYAAANLAEIDKNSSGAKTSGELL